MDDAALEELQQLLMATFAEEASEQVAELEGCLAACRAGDADHDWPRAQRLAHTLRGSARAVGLTDAEEAAAELEELLIAVQASSPTDQGMDRAGELLSVLRHAASGDAPHVDVAPAPVAEQGTRVLVADDSAVMRRMHQAMLEKGGCQVEVAEDGQQAWEMLVRGDFEILISDVEMPVLDGLGLTRRVRLSQELSALPIILVSSRESAEQKQAGLAAGAHAYLGKSEVTHNTLMRLLQEALDD